MSDYIPSYVFIRIGMRRELQYPFIIDLNLKNWGLGKRLKVVPSRGHRRTVPGKMHSKGKIKYMYT